MFPLAGNAEVDGEIRQSGEDAVDAGDRRYRSGIAHAFE